MQYLEIHRRHIPDDVARFTVMKEQLDEPRALPRGVNRYSDLIPEKPYAVTLLDASSGVRLPDRYTHSMIADNSLFREFVEANNMLVRVAQEFQVSADQLYDSFYTLGMRLSQQISERLKERTEARYESAVVSLQDALLDRIREKRELAHTTDLDRLVSDEGLAHVPSPDRELITTMVAQLRDIPFPEPSAVSFDGKVTYFRHERYAPIAGACIEVLPELRADFLATIKYGPLHGISPDPLDREHDNIKAFVQRLSVDAARQYLEALRSEYGREKGDVLDVFQHLNTQATGWEGDHLVLLCETLQRADRANLLYGGVNIAVAAVGLLDRYDLDGARRIVTRALNRFRGRRTDQNALRIIDDAVRGSVLI
ncbi:hypothetical protein HYW21_03705 [Candidatus Woesearchaeota archaeon]|nr:hypothetical protein [Candidatus Woesearchaeota archaeon]